nr:MAG TPA_asm: hypothetical protein [Caudoviricetes sp.]
MNSAIMDIIGILLMTGAIILIAIGFFWKE